MAALSVPIRLVDRLGSLPREERRPGDAKWATHQASPHPGGLASLLFCCPCGCGDLSVVAIMPMDGRSHWSWNGNRELPTLQPSILRTSGCGWHGWLTDGVFRS